MMVWLLLNVRTELGDMASRLNERAMERHRKVCPFEFLFFFFLNLNLYSAARTTRYRGGRVEATRYA
jgi:hypothetical protein